MRSLGRAVFSLNSALGALAGAAGFGAIISRTANATRTTIAYSEALGVSVENLSRWEFAARSAGLEGDKVADIMKDAADKIGDAFRNNAGEAKEAIQSLGLDLEQLAQMSPDQQLLSLAGALGTVETRAEKIQIMESIGNDLSLLLPLLEDGGKRLQEMAKRSDELGTTLTKVEAEKIRQADDALREMRGALEALGQTLTAAVGPAFSKLIRQLGSVIPVIADEVSEKLSFLGAAAAAAWRALNPSDITGAETFSDALVDELDKVRQAREQLKAASEQLPAIVVNPEAEAAAAAARDAFRQAELEKVFFFEDAKTRAVRDGNIARLKFSTLSAKEQTKHVVGEAIKLTRGVTGESKKLFKINKAAGIANAIINAHEGASKSLSKYPWPLAGVMAALHLAAGMAQVSAIRSASFGGGGGGGGSTVGGAAAPPTPPSDFATPVDQRGGPREVHITIEGSGRLNRDQAEEIARSLAELIEDGAEVAAI